MTVKLYKAAEVCDVAQLQPYVLRSWEKEFPGIGVQKSSDGPRLYRQADVDQVLRIKQLVFGEGLTLSGARRRMEGEGPRPAPVVEPIEPEEEDEPVETLGADARQRISSVRDGLRLLLDMVSQEPGSPARDAGYELKPPPVNTRPAATASPARANAARGKATRSASRSRGPKVQRSAVRVRK